MDLSLEEQTNKYNDLITSHLKEIPNKMFTFEVTKCCNYSTLVFLYKEDMVSNLFLQVAKHFGCQKLVSLYMLDQEGQKVIIPFNIYMSLKEFIFEQTNNQRILKPIYDVPLPVVYRIYLDDGHHHHHHHHIH
jgi:hypothetical protein